MSPMYQLLLIDKYGALMWLWSSGKPKDFPPPVAFCPPRILHRLHWDWTCASAGRSVRLLLALASTVILGFQSRRDPWPYFSFEREEGSDYYWSLPLYWGGGDSSRHSLTNSPFPPPPPTHTHTQFRLLCLRGESLSSSFSQGACNACSFRLDYLHSSCVEEVADEARRTVDLFN
jgi:hypothetical protein